MTGTDTGTVTAATWAGVATAIGSWPGTDPITAAEVVVGELPVPHVVELPARGIGADMIGRTAAMLVDIPFDLSTTGYRLAARRGRAAVVADDLLRRDVDAFERAIETAGRAGGVVKVQAAGPLTLAAALELPDGARAVTDPGARRDLADSLGEGLARHAAQVAERTGSTVLVQLDEPSLPAVLAGSLPGRHRWESVPAVHENDAQVLLDTTIGIVGRPVAVHVCAPSVPAGLVRRSAAAALAIDTHLLTRADLDPIGEVIDSDTTLVLGLVPSTRERVDVRAVVDPAVRLVDRLGFPRTVLRAVGVTPTCGLAGADPEWARDALRLVRDAAARLGDAPEEL